MSSRDVVAAAVVILVGGLLGVLLLGFLAPSTFPGADLAVYRLAGQDLWQSGDPYLHAREQPYVFQYRYPPLLAMAMPILGWAPLWYALLAAATLWTFVIGLRQAGPAYLLPIWVLGGAWGSVLINGNVQGLVVGAMASVPLYRRGGAVALAVATCLKIYPGRAVIWYVGRRDWVALGWYLGALAALLLLQAPWLPAMVNYYVAEPQSSPFAELGFGLRAIHPVLWIAGSVVVAVLALRYAESRAGWLLAVAVTLVALPRVLLANLALILAAPLRPSPDPIDADGRRAG